MKRFLWLFLLLILIWPSPAHAQGTPTCHFEADGSIVCTTGGGGGGEEGGNGGEGEEGDDENGDDSCTPGRYLRYELLSYDPATGTCQALLVWADNCTDQMIEANADGPEEIPCWSQPETPENPCDTFTVDPGGISCEAFGWRVSARVTFPEIYLDVRPYPATLVRWPTAVRCGGLGISSGSGGVDYIPYGGGTAARPQAGDWRDLTLTLSLRPTGNLSISLPWIESLTLPDHGSTGTPTIIHWDVPSHPAAGGGPLAGSVAGLDELPGDVPLFVGRGRAPYRLFWQLSYEQYQALEECRSGPDAAGTYNCNEGKGHTVIVGYAWQGHTQGGEIPPSAVQNLPVSVMADLDGDGTPEAYWNTNLTLRRMDDHDRLDNPAYRRSWNWGGTIYWAVREGQGQIGWPK